MKLDQVSARYQQDQDRILVRMNTSADHELRLWLTRRLCLRLWPNLNTVVADRVARMEGARNPSLSVAATADGATRQMLADFQREETLKTTDFKTPYRNTPQQWPLGEEPLVVTEVGLTNLPDGRLQMEFREKLPGRITPRSFSVSLENRNLHGFLHLLEKALQKSGWLVEAVVARPKGAAMASGEKPRYLN